MSVKIEKTHIKSTIKVYTLTENDPPSGFCISEDAGLISQSSTNILDYGLITETVTDTCDDGLITETIQ